MKKFKYLCVFLLSISTSVFADSVHRSDYANVERQRIAQLENSDFRNPYLNSSMNNYRVQMRNEYEERKLRQQINNEYRMNSRNSYEYSRNNMYSNNNYQGRESYYTTDNRNMRPYQDIEKDNYGKVVDIQEREQCVEVDRTSGSDQLTGALIGGAVGNQFGSGNGRKVMTATGAIIGAGMATDQSQDCSFVYTMVIERKIRINGERDVEYMTFNSDMPIGIGTKVKLSNY